jgi:long-chain fatty acid transport protein
MTERAGNCPEHPSCFWFLRNAFRVCLPISSFAILAATQCYGSAFSISELGARAAGMGTAFIGTADDGSALFYNPAGIAFQPGTHLEMDSAVIVGLFRFTPNPVPVGQTVPSNGFSMDVKPHFIPIASLYATKQLSKKITLGFGIFTPFGLAANSTNFNDSDPNLTKVPSRFAGTRVRLESYWFQPTIAYKLTDNLAVSIAPDFVHTHLELEESILNPLDPNGAQKFGVTAAPTVLPGLPVNEAAAIIARLLPEGRSRIAGTANGPAGSAGLLWKNAVHKTNIGLMYRSSIVNHLSGKASFAFGNQPYALEQYVGPSFLPNAFPNQKITGSFPTPATYGIGFSNSSFWNTRISVDVRLQDYKKFKNVPLDFPINDQLPGDKNLGLDPEKILNFNFRESWNIAIGAEKPINSTTTVRMGYQFDLSPVVPQSVGPLFPDADRNSLTFGGTKTYGTKEFTFFYEAMFYLNRVTNVPSNDYQWTNGDYSNFVHVFGLGLRFDGSDLSLRKKH